MKSRPIIAEIIGPSGAGKSTLAAVLNSRSQKVKAGLTIWRLPFFLLLISGILSLPDLIRLGLERRLRIRGADLKQIIRLQAFYRLLKKEIKENDPPKSAALFFDEGVIFALAKLRADSGGRVGGKILQNWEEEILNRWAKIIDAVIWLDAPDRVLVKRINRRAKLHRMKHRPDQEIFNFLAQYRVSYEYVIAELEKRGGLQITRFKSDESSLERIADEILRIIDAPENTRIFEGIFEDLEKDYLDRKGTFYATQNKPQSYFKNIR